MKIPKKVRAIEVQRWDMVQTRADYYEGPLVETVEYTKKGKVLLTGTWGMNPIFGHGLDPQQWVHILVDSEYPDVSMGVYEI